MATRMNISISDELKERMDGIGESVNWSKIAAQAFERKLNDDRDTADQDWMDEMLAATDQQPRTSMDALLEYFSDENPGMVAAIKKEIGPVLDRYGDREHLRDSIMEFKIEEPWPLESAEDVVKIVRQATFGFQNKVIEPLMAGLLMEIVYLRLEGIRKKATD